MAKKARYDWGRSANGRYQKFETRITTKFNATHDTADAVYIDVAQCLSALNRKLVRQGQVFKVKGMKLWSTNSSAPSMDVGVGVLPRTWTVFNAYKKARSLWNAANLQALQGVGSGNLPKYYDFKVLMDKYHFDNEINDDGGALTRNLLPCDIDGDALTGGEWVYSKWEDSGSTSSMFYGHMLGPHLTAAGADEGSSGTDIPADGGSAGLVLAYQQSRGLPFADQDVSGQDQMEYVASPWVLLFGDDTQTTQTITHLAADNDDCPYDIDAYVGGAAEHPGAALVSRAHFSAVDTPRGIPTFEAPLGLIRLDVNTANVSSDVNNVWCTFDTEIMGEC